ncbi:hypothetical protein [Paenibacillus sp. NPDC055715]
MTLPLRFPTGTSLAIDWFDSMNIDTASGAVQGLTTDDGAKAIQWGDNSGTKQQLPVISYFKRAVFPADHCYRKNGFFLRENDS